METNIKLGILYRSKVITEMTLEDLEIWKNHKRIYPSCLRFPESVEWNMQSQLNRNKCIKDLNSNLKRCDKYIQELISPKMPRGKMSKEMKVFIVNKDKMLKIHLKKLKEFRDKRLNEKLEVPFSKRLNTTSDVQKR